jgi:hypothetical protein
MSSIQLVYPVEFILLCIAIGFIYAFILYRREAPWKRWINNLLFGARWLLVTLLCVLLLSPVIRLIKNTTEKPAVVLAIDNSTSISAVYDSVELNEISTRIFSMETAFEEVGFETEYVTLDGEIEFEAQQTNLNGLLQDIRNDYEGRNLQEVILISDGLVNQGVSPAYSTLPFRVSTVGLGDSIEKKDIRIETLTYNKVAYQGNRFPIVASVFQNGYEGENITIEVLDNGAFVTSSDLILNSSGQQNVTLLLNADSEGMHRYTVRTTLKSDEFIVENNEREAFIEIIEGKEKVCIVSAAPHPDINAFVAALQKNTNYEIEQFILSIDTERSAFNQRNESTDLFILHQLPSTRFPVNWEEKLGGSSVLFMYGPQMDLRGLNDLADYFNTQAYPGEYDEVAAVFNPSYAPFTYSDELLRTLGELPPLTTPFGEIDISGSAEVMMYQKVGSIETTKPLLVTIESGETKSGIIMASGIWKWKLSDYAQNKNNERFEELIQKLVQYLSTRADKRRFRLYPLKEEYSEGEEVIFESEVYNELYERVYGNRINLVITSQDGTEQSYSYVTSEASSRYTITGLDEGVYKYSATTEMDGSNEAVQGEFVVRELNLETLRLTADFSLLRQIADRNGGSFYSWNEVNKLLDDYSGLEARGIIYSEEKYLSAINMIWLFILFVCLITVEWTIRKYHGSY